jgi:glycosyltransferase involved in cell wall biosynthesis
MTNLNCSATDQKDTLRQADPADISVIVVTYNHEDFIAQAIESVLAQSTDRLLEVIISEDKSTDRTRDIVKDYARRDKRIRLILSERNVRSNEVVARALRSAVGRYVCILDGDDYWLASDKLEHQATFLDANPHYSAVFHNAFIEDTLPAKRRWTRSDLPKMFTLNEIWRGNPFATCAGRVGQLV